ncbi:hypothetical protein NP493_7241g00000 [Ridgeia piscesae]|uniref:ZSWIM1/3 RNaseH-like domain-containing protein n=1 Tax=Ridgeia piscesae TaxID=27915 RepID=A0AAD9MP86_RIDPI|nr:hypothetical protein NP493_7241g00000 [Ridgeia piscesae]
MLKLKSSKKLLQVFIHEQTGKVVTLRDVSNIQTNMRCHDGNDLTKVVTRLRAMEEVVMADATYKLTDLRMPLFLMIGIDGDGHSQVVAVYLTCTETAAALTHMLEGHGLICTGLLSPPLAALRERRSWLQRSRAHKMYSPLPVY